MDTWPVLELNLCNSRLPLIAEAADRCYVRSELEMDTLCFKFRSNDTAEFSGRLRTNPRTASCTLISPIIDFAVCICDAIYKGKLTMIGQKARQDLP